MLRITKEEVDRIKKVIEGSKDRNTGDIIKDLRNAQVKYGGSALKRCGENSDFYLIDETLYNLYLVKCKHYFKMYDLFNGEWKRVDGFGKLIPEKEIIILDSHILQNSKKV